jgi:hypothetical protein
MMIFQAHDGHPPPPLDMISHLLLFFVMAHACRGEQTLCRIKQIAAYNGMTRFSGMNEQGGGVSILSP